MDATHTEPLPDSDDDLARDELPRDTADRAIGRYDEALRENVEAYRLADGRRDLEPWTNLTTMATINTRRVLVHAILAHFADYNGVRRHMAEKRHWTPRGIRSGRKLYLAVPNETQEGESEKLDGPDVMSVLVIPEEAIVDLDTPEEASPSLRADQVVVESNPKPLTDAERAIQSIAVDLVRRFGEREAIDRLLLGGAYGRIAEAVDRLGTDAVAELRRQIQAGASVAVDRGSET